jgi:hypothetical protein
MGEEVEVEVEVVGREEDVDEAVEEGEVGEADFPPDRETTLTTETAMIARTMSSKNSAHHRITRFALQLKVVAMASWMPFMIV